MFCCRQLVIGKGLGTRIAFCYCSEQGHKCRPWHPGTHSPSLLVGAPSCLACLPSTGNYFRLLPPLWVPQCRACSVHPTSCAFQLGRRYLILACLIFFFVSLVFFFFLYSAMVTVGGTARLQKPQKRPPGSSHVPHGLWHPLVWLMWAAQPASPAGHFPRHSLFFSHMVKSHLGWVTFNGVRKIYTVEAQLQVGPSAFLPGG